MTHNGIERDLQEFLIALEHTTSEIRDAIIDKIHTYRWTPDMQKAELIEFIKQKINRNVAECFENIPWFLFTVVLDHSDVLTT